MLVASWGSGRGAGVDAGNLLTERYWKPIARFITAGHSGNLKACRLCDVARPALGGKP
jgi:hypothetical protein